ncbi:Cysteine desulfurase, mitosomal, partial [Dictyocoela roeselum]
IPIDVDRMNLGMVSISGHKIYGPKGVGALYIRKRPRIRLSPLFSGGGQERGLRSGTVPTPLAVGIGKAAEIARKTMKEEAERIKRLSLLLLNSIKKRVNVIKNGSMDIKKWFPGCLNISFPHVEGESLMMKLKNVALSSGSACTSASLEPSYVLRALGTDDDLAHSSIRFGIGRFTTKDEIKEVAKKTVKAVKELQEMSPLYEMEKEGIDLKSINWTA